MKHSALAHEKRTHYIFGGAIIICTLVLTAIVSIMGGLRLPWFTDQGSNAPLPMPPTTHAASPAPRGFTLIELLVVIAIIGLLSSVVLASLNTARVKGMDAQRFANLQSVQQAIELYATNHNGQYPNTGGGSWNSTCPAWTVTTQNNAIPGLVADGDIPSLPLDPQVSGNTCCYMYYSGGGTTDYKYMLYNCPSSPACGGGASQTTGGLKDPARSSGCAVYTPGAAAW